MLNHIFFMVDWPLLYSALLFFGLSWLYAWFVLQFPKCCQLKWSLVSVFGIASIGLYEAWLRWNVSMLPQSVIADMVILFIASFPGMLYLNYQQIKVLGYEYENSDFYYIRYIGTLNTWRNFICYSRLPVIFRTVFTDSYRLIPCWLNRTLRPDVYRKVPQDKRGKIKQV